MGLLGEIKVDSQNHNVKEKQWKIILYGWTKWNLYLLDIKEEKFHPNVA